MDSCDQIRHHDCEYNYHSIELSLPVQTQLSRLDAALCLLVVARMTGSQAVSKLRGCLPLACFSCLQREGPDGASGLRDVVVATTSGTGVRLRARSAADMLARLFAQSKGLGDSFGLHSVTSPHLSGGLVGEG